METLCLTTSRPRRSNAPRSWSSWRLAPWFDHRCHATLWQASCHCAKPHDPGHDPQFRLTRRVAGKTVTETSPINPCGNHAGGESLADPAIRGTPTPRSNRSGSRGSRPALSASSRRGRGPDPTVAIRSAGGRSAPSTMLLRPARAISGLTFESSAHRCRSGPGGAALLPVLAMSSRRPTSA